MDAMIQATSVVVSLDFSFILAQTLAYQHLGVVCLWSANSQTGPPAQSPVVQGGKWEPSFLLLFNLSAS
jgi:hypothetical protein